MKRNDVTYSNKRNHKHKKKVRAMSNTLQIQLPGQNIPVKDVQVKTDLSKVIDVLESISSD